MVFTSCQLAKSFTVWLCTFSLTLSFSHSMTIVYTRTMHAYDASHCTKCYARMGRAAQVSGFARLVGAQRTVQKNDNVKSEPKYLAYEGSPICVLYFWTLSCSSVALLASTVDWLLCFVFSQSHQPLALFSTRLCTWLRKIHTLQRANCAVLPILRLQETSSRCRRVMHISDILPGHERKLTLRVWPPIDILKYTRTSRE